IICYIYFHFAWTPLPPISTSFPYTTLFRSYFERHGPAFDEVEPLAAQQAGELVFGQRVRHRRHRRDDRAGVGADHHRRRQWLLLDRKSTRLNSSHVAISYAVFCLKKKKYIK